MGASHPWFRAPDPPPVAYIVVPSEPAAPSPSEAATAAATLPSPYAALPPEVAENIAARSSCEALPRLAALDRRMAALTSRYRAGCMTSVPAMQQRLAAAWLAGASLMVLRRAVDDGSQPSVQLTWRTPFDGERTFLNLVASRSAHFQRRLPTLQYPFASADRTLAERFVAKVLTDGVPPDDADYRYGSSLTNRTAQQWRDLLRDGDVYRALTAIIVDAGGQRGAVEIGADDAQRFAAAVPLTFARGWSSSFAQWFGGDADSGVLTILRAILAAPSARVYAYDSMAYGAGISERYGEPATAWLDTIVPAIERAGVDDRALLLRCIYVNVVPEKFRAWLASPEGVSGALLVYLAQLDAAVAPNGGASTRWIQDVLPGALAVAATADAGQREPLALAVAHVVDAQGPSTPTQEYALYAGGTRRRRES